MLRFLAVRHLAVIEELAVEFEPGLNLITGETGAGKSMLVEAIDLLMGARASADLVRTGEQTASIQAIFEHPDGRDVIVRREISAQGRSRAFIDDTLATGAALRELGGRLIDLHGQHEHQALFDPSEHLAQLDAFLDQPQLLARIAAAFEEWRAAASAVGRSKMDDRDRRNRIEMATFHLQEIDKVAPQAGEDQRLEAEKLLLANVEKLSRLSAEAYAALYEGESAALAQLAVVWKRLADLATLDGRFQPYLDQRAALKSGLEDTAFFLRSYASGLEASPDRLQAVEDRLAALGRLIRKHGPALSDVLARQQALREELAALESTDEQAARLSHAEEAARAAFERLAGDLSDRRQAAAVSLARTLELALADVAMPHSKVAILVTPATDAEGWTRRGLDRVEILLSPNPGEEPRPLARIASGGELSRVMLALRTVVAQTDAFRTLVFDEVDAGIGGAAADAVGARLEALGRAQQVICITHLAQIAARPGAHFQIAKQVRGGRTVTAVTRLDQGGRELEIARMIAGASVSAHVINSARELLATRSESEIKAKGESERPKAKGRKS